MIVRPNLKFLFAHPSHVIALGIGTGLAPIAPGTVGTLLGFPCYWGLEAIMGSLGALLSCVPLFLLGIWACKKTGDDLGVADHSGMVWDEVVAFIAILVFTPAGWGWQVTAFFVFRCFDVLKPPPIRQVDRHWKGGFGVMFDDIIAAAYTLLVLAILVRALD